MQKNKDPMAVALGSKGGIASAKKLTKTQRIERAKLAVSKRKDRIIKIKQTETGL